ncbi:MAG TPA: hypothetical protein VGM41_10230 [Chitinophagaceae bacterium]|jgi:hypothetical protein
MDTKTVIILGAGLLVVLGGLYFYFYQKDKKSLASVQQPTTTDASRALQLQAYERLVILADRIAIPNLVSRSNQPGLTKTEMQLLLVQVIKQEFDHNLSQQIYVSPEAWEAVRNLKEQNIHLINQVAGILPPDTTGTDLNKQLLDFVVHQQNGSMHNLVQEALSYEAKKIMR